MLTSPIYPVILNQNEGSQVAKICHQYGYRQLLKYINKKYELEFDFEESFPEVPLRSNRRSPGQLD